MEAGILFMCCGYTIETEFIFWPFKSGSV